MTALRNALICTVLASAGKFLYFLYNKKYIGIYFKYITIYHYNNIRSTKKSNVSYII